MPTITVATTQRRAALSLLNAAMEESGLGAATSILSSDDTVKNVLRLMNGVGEDLARQPFWPELIRTWTVTTVADQTAYDLPADWGVPLPGTTWDRTGRWPLQGPHTASNWQRFLSGVGGSGAAGYNYRFFDGKLNLEPAPPVGLSLTLEYTSYNWVLGLNGAVANIPKPRFTLDTDYCLFDERLLLLGTRVAFQESKGLDSSLAKRRFEDALEAAIFASGGAPILSLVGCPARLFLDYSNVPDSGYGL